MGSSGLLCDDDEYSIEEDEEEYDEEEFEEESLSETVGDTIRAQTINDVEAESTGAVEETSDGDRVLSILESYTNQIADWESLAEKLRCKVVHMLDGDAKAYEE